MLTNGLRSTIFICFLWMAVFCAGAASATTPACGPLATNQTETSYFSPLQIDPSIYNTPYHVSLFNPQNGEDGQRLWSQTKSIFFYGIGAVLFLAALPEDFTGWDTDRNITRKWRENVREGPVWDRDKWYINYIGHPYFGGVYYQMARKSGYRQWDSFFYSFLMSTIYWEYGVEAFAETPSIQDLVVHPVLGWVCGEWMFQTERKVRENGNTVAGSKLLGGVSLFFLDPIDSMGRGINRVTGRNFIKSGYGYFSYAAAPAGSDTDHQIYLNMTVPIGGSSSDTEKKELPPVAHRRDPVDTGIVGVSADMGHTFLDSEWNVENDLLGAASLGLYFTPRLSTRLQYAIGELRSETTGKDVTYENYSFGGQCYLLTRRRIRPYITAGFGEQMWEKDRDNKTFQWNGGIGLHVKLLDKVALQTDWTHYYSPSDNVHDQIAKIRLVYRFGRGEHDQW